MAILKKASKKSYTVIDMSIVRDKRLSLKDLGLLVQLLSLPDNWHFSEKGLEKIFENDGKTSIRTAIKHLEQFHYLKRNLIHSNGKFSGIEWCIFETPYEENVSKDNSRKPYSENQNSENVNSENVNSENQPQYNINKEITHISKSQSQSQSQSQSHDTTFSNTDFDTDFKKNAKKMSASEKDTDLEKEIRYIPEDYNTAQKQLQANIEYEHLKKDFPSDIGLIDELLLTMVDVCTSNKSFMKVAGDVKNTEFVKNVYYKLNYKDIVHVISRFKSVTSPIKHISSYLKTALFNCKQEIQHFCVHATNAMNTGSNNNIPPTTETFHSRRNKFQNFEPRKWDFEKIERLAMEN